MIAETNSKWRQAWARSVGFLLLLTNATATVAVWAGGTYVVENDPRLTAANLASSGTLARTGLALELITIAGVIPLVAGLYLILRTVGPGLALVAALWRMVENCVLAAITFAGFTALALLPQGASLDTRDPDHVHDLIFAMLHVHSWGFQVGFLFLGLGQALFSWLWWRSRYIPRWLAGLGIVASLVMASMAIGIIVWPRLYLIVTMAYMAPMGIYEIGLGLWLMIRGVRIVDQRV